MSPGALYRYYPSKDAIIEAIAEDERTRAGAVMRRLNGEGSFVDRVVAAGLDYLDMMRRPGGCELMVEILAESLRSTTVGARFHCVESDIQDEFRRAVEEAQEAGEVTRDLDAGTIVRMLFSIGDGLALRLGLEPKVDLQAIEPALRRIVSGLVAP